jgi:hypothetical protein
MRVGKTERVPFLGVISVQASPQERTRAALPEGIGLTVLYVVGDSPAQAAGLQRFDLLHKFNDQILINEAQLRVLLRTTKPGDTIELTFLRGGNPQKVSVRPVEKEVGVVEGSSAGMMLWSLGPAQGVTPGVARSGFSARYEDDAYVLELKSDRQGKYLVAKDKKGVVVFQGAVNTPDQRNAVPAALRPKLDKLETPPPPKVQPAAPPPAQPTPGLS